MLKTINAYWRKWLVGTILILLLALLLHLPFFAELPSGLNRDEAALGYNAYSLLKTGKDEWGKSWPISITSFGDQKLPGYIYTLIPFIAIFGLETWVVRLPSFLASLLIIISTGLVAIQLAKALKLSEKLQLSLSLITMMLVAISPWQMHFSRVAYETHLAMAFFVLGLANLLFALTKQEKIKQRAPLIITSLLFSLSMLSYHSYQIFIPLFVFISICIFKKKIQQLDKIGLLIGALLGLLIVFLLFKGGVMQANQVKSIGTSPFSKQSLLLSAVKYRETNDLPILLNKLFFNRLTEGVVKLSQNYLTTFSGAFFFVQGSGHGDHNPGNGNNLHLFIAPFIVLGFLFLWTKRKNALSKLIMAWLFLALLPSALTINPLLEVRIATAFPVLELLAAIGIVYLFSFLSIKWRIFAGSFLIIVTILATLRLFIFYTIIAPRSTFDNSSYHQLAKILAKYQAEPELVLTQSPANSPYIWYLFENKINPTLAQESIVHYPDTDEGFKHVKQIGNIYFETISWDSLENKPYILILKPTEISMDQRMNPQFSLIEVITNESNQAIYEVWKYNH